MEVLDRVDPRLAQEGFGLEGLLAEEISALCGGNGGFGEEKFSGDAFCSFMHLRARHVGQQHGGSRAWCLGRR